MPIALWALTISAFAIGMTDACLSLATRLVATTEPTPKNAPCANEATTRAIIISGFPAAAVSPILLLFGVGLVIGNLLGGKFADKYLMPTLMISAS